jgi:hypothetical protein
MAVLVAAFIYSTTFLRILSQPVPARDNSPKLVQEKFKYKKKKSSIGYGEG